MNVLNEIMYIKVIYVLKYKYWFLLVGNNWLFNNSGKTALRAQRLQILGPDDHFTCDPIQNFLFNCD